MLHKAELLLGLSRHLSAYQISAAHAAMESLQYAGQVYELAWRLRNSGLSSARRIQAIAVEAKIGARQLDREVLPTLEQLGWVQCRRDGEKRLVSVSALMPPPDELVEAANRMLDLVMATPVQRAALVLLDATARQPLERTTALHEAAVHFGDEAAEDALRHLSTIQLVRQAESDDNRAVVFNPNIWVGDEQVIRAALRAEDARVHTEVGSLLEEVAASPGIPEVHVKSTEQRWVDFAVAHGLVQRSMVQTSNGTEQRFLFSPHLGRDAFGTAAADPSGHVRQLVGSMIYAATFAKWRLHSPGAFIYTLIRDGVAGDVAEIGTDYPMLETAGTIKVIRGSTSRRFTMQLLQADVAEAALAILDSRGASRGESAENGAALGDQRSYNHLESERARLATEVPLDDTDARRLIDALRDVSARRSFGGR